MPQRLKLEPILKCAIRICEKVTTALVKPCLLHHSEITTVVTTIEAAVETTNLYAPLDIPAVLN